MSKPTIRELRELIQPGPRTEKRERESNGIAGAAVGILLMLATWALILCTYWTVKGR